MPKLGKISEVFRDSTAVESARYAVAAAFIDDLQAKGLDEFYPDGGHPAIKGYRAYASVAHYVLRNMQKTK